MCPSSPSHRHLNSLPWFTKSADGELVSLEICERLKNLSEELAKDSHHAKKIRVEVGKGVVVSWFTCYFATWKVLEE